MKVTNLVASERAWRYWQSLSARRQHGLTATPFGDPEWQRKQRELVQRAMSRGQITVNPPTLAPAPYPERPPTVNVERKKVARPAKNWRAFQNRSL